MPEFHLSPSGAGGISCDADGAFVGAVPILHRLRMNDCDKWLPRDCEELSEQVSELYGLPIDMSPKIDGLKAVARALNEGDVARAQIATVLLGIPDIPRLSKDARPRDRMIKLIRDLQWSGMLKWDSDEHPRWPAGTPDDKGGKKGGKFAPKGEGGETSALPTPPYHATDQENSHSFKPADSEHKNIWQMFGSYLSHEAKSALVQIGQTGATESYNNLTMAIAERDAVAHALRDYAEYRAQLFLDSHGRTVEIPAIDIGNPVAGPAELMIRLTAHERLTRHAINADWIDPLFSLAATGAAGAAVPFRFAGPVAEALDGADVSALSANAAEDVDTLDQLLAAANRAAAKVGPGSGRLHGTAVHSAFRDEVGALGNTNFSTEQSYLNGRAVPYGTPGSVRVDVIEGPLDSPTTAYDLKTGKATLIQSRIRQIRSHLPPGAEHIPFHEVRP